MDKNKVDNELEDSHPPIPEIIKDAKVQEAILYATSIFGLIVSDDDTTYHFLEIMCKRYHDQTTRTG